MKRIHTLSASASVFAALLLVQTPNESLAAAKPDVKRPTAVITYPAVNHSVTNATITVTGKAKDNVAVTNVSYQVNGTGWNPAATTNAWTNWTADVTLTPWTNTLQAYAVDSSGNRSLTNTVKFVYLLTGQLAVQVKGLGTVTPNYNGKWLQIGKTYKMTAKAGKGFAFADWTGSLATNKPALTFLMASNLTFTANFDDVARPVAVILSPKVHQHLTNALCAVSGKASDNVGVAQVSYQLNGAGWNPAASANDWTNWTASVTLTQSTNLLQAYASDAAGNASLTNSVSFVYVSTAPADWAPASLSGLTAEVTGSADTNNLFTLSFGASTFSQSMLPGTNEHENAVGTYTYAKLGTNTALLTAISAARPDSAGQTNAPALTFTNSHDAEFILTNNEGTIVTGVIRLSQAANLAPASLAGKTVHAVDSASGEPSTSVFGNGTFKNTSHSGSVSSGSYTFTRYSPVGAFLLMNFTSPPGAAGDVNYVVVTFSAPKAGSYFSVHVPSGHEPETTSGTFTMP
ncbi:MAG: Ig-like domain-containing protein [Verrucomicrobiota bacterium]|jgi:hypothetical protein